MEARFTLDGDVERLVWERSLQVYGELLSEVLDQALAGYTRAPGFDDLTRLYAETAGHAGLVMLRQALIDRWPYGEFGHSESCIELRSRLRSHLSQHLLRRLV
ncbi:hypothetical protein, partial [Pseudomonas plecoglossicida]